MVNAGKEKGGDCSGEGGGGGFAVLSLVLNLEANICSGTVGPESHQANSLLVHFWDFSNAMGRYLWLCYRSQVDTDFLFNEETSTCL